MRGPLQTGFPRRPDEIAAPYRRITESADPAELIDGGQSETELYWGGSSPRTSTTRQPADARRVGRLQVVVRAIAERRSAGVLALAEIHRLRFFCRPGHRREGRVLMRAIAEWLICGLAAGAPIVRLARFHFDWLRPLFGHYRLSAHPCSPSRAPRYDPRRIARLSPRLSARAITLLPMAGAHNNRCSGSPGAKRVENSAPGWSKVG